MIRNYIRPQTEIYQVLEETANPLLDRIHAVIVGPAYTHADAVAGNLNFVTYQENDVLAYTKMDGEDVVTKGDEVVDQDEVSLSAKDLRIELFEDKAGFILDPVNPSGNVLVYDLADGFYNSEDPDAALDFDAGRFPTVGDTYKISDGVKVRERLVVGLQGKDIAAAVVTGAYSGALPWPYSSAPENTAAVTSANFTNSGVSAGDGGALSAAAARYVRRFGKPLLGDQGGLRITYVLTCATGVTAANDPSTAVFKATANGVSLSAVGVTSSTNTLVTLGGVAADLEFKVLGYRNWQTGDRITLTIDYSEEVIIPDETVFDTQLDVTDYIFVGSNKRIPSSITISPIAISDTDVVTFRISDSSNLMTSTVATSDGSAPVVVDLDYDGVTLTLTIPSFSDTAFHVGQKFTQAVTPPTRSTTIFDKVVLNVPIGNLDTSGTILVSAYTKYSGPIPAIEPILSSVNYTVDAEDVTLGTLQVSVPGYTEDFNSVRPAVDGVGSVALIWRALIATSDATGLVEIETVQDIIDNYKSIGLGSELGYGLLKALGGSQGKRVYGLNTGGKSLEAFVDAFDKLEAANYIYTIGVLTEDEEVMKLAASHVQAMSQPDVKRFRRAYVGTDSPGEYDLIGLQDSGAPFTATIETGNSGKFNSVTFEQELTYAEYPVSVGDFLEITGTGQRFAIAEVHQITLTGATPSLALLLAEDVGYPVDSTAMKVIAADTAANTAKFVWNRSTRLGQNREEDRRIANIWQDGGRLNGILIPNRFGACEIAGIRTALQPQQGLTRTEISFIDSSPSMYTKFKPTLLDDMAARGVWIIAQNSADLPCYVRHQLTTAVSNGSLYYEDSVGTNVDSVCFALDDIVEPLIGKRNATPDTVLEIKSLHINLLDGLTKTAGVSQIGPQIISFFNQNDVEGTIDVLIDPNFKDRINEFIGLEVPLPLNNIRILVQARTIKRDGVFVNSLSVSFPTGTAQ